MATPLRWFASVALAASLGMAALAPLPAHAQNDALAMTRVLVDIADVVVNGGVPYYRYGHYRPADRLVVERDYYGRPVYYRMVPRTVYYTRPRVAYYAPPPVVYRPVPRGHAYGYWAHRDRDRDRDRDWDDRRWRGRDGDWDRDGDHDGDRRHRHHGDD